MATISGDFSTNLVGHWKLEEASGTRVDELGNNNLGDYNTVTSGTGKQGDGAQFTKANNEYLYKASTTALPSGSGAFTISTWFKLTDVSGGYFLPIEWGTAGSGTRIEVYWEASSNKWYITDNHGYVYYTKTGMGDGNMHHLFIAFAGGSLTATNIIMRVDDIALSGTSVGGYTPNVGSGGITIGNSALEGFPSVFAVSGIIDEVSIWAAQLSAANGTTIYNSGNGIAYGSGGGGPVISNQYLTMLGIG